MFLCQIGFDDNLNVIKVWFKVDLYDMLPYFGVVGKYPVYKLIKVAPGDGLIQSETL
jgi:hypothetical protein